MKKLFLILTAFLLSIPFYPVNATEKTSDTLKENVVTTGDGLYVDSTIDGRYIYKGGNPNNYIKLGDDLYRIMSIEKDGTIKVIRQESIGEMGWDPSKARYSTNSEDFCSNEFSCKAWGSNVTTLDTTGKKVSQMPWEVNGTLKNLPEKEATLNTYLNNDFYNGLSNDVKSLIVEGTWNVGPTAWSQTNLSESIKEESAYKWKGKVALMNVTDYVKASSNSECASVNDYYFRGTSSCKNDSNVHNYLYLNNRPWTLSPDSDSKPHQILAVGTDAALYSRGGNSGSAVNPVFYLSSETKLNGEGTETNPYTLPKRNDVTEETKEDENTNTSNNENETNNKIKADDIKVVGVPSTSLDAKNDNKVQTVKNANVLETKTTPTFGLMIIGITFISGLAFISNKLLKSKA